MKIKNIRSYLSELEEYLQSEDTKVMRKIGNEWVEIDKRVGSKLQLIGYILYCTK